MNSKFEIKISSKFFFKHQVLFSHWFYLYKQEYENSSQFNPYKFITHMYAVASNQT